MSRSDWHAPPYRPPQLYLISRVMISSKSRIVAIPPPQFSGNVDPLWDRDQSDHHTTLITTTHWSSDHSEWPNTMATDHQKNISLHLCLYDCCNMNYLFAEHEWLKRKTHSHTPQLKKYIVGLIWSSYIIFGTSQNCVSRKIYKVVFVLLLGLHLKVLSN